MKKGKIYTIIVTLYGPVMRRGRVVPNQRIARIRSQQVVGSSVESREKLALGLIPIGYHKNGDILYCNVKDDKGKVREHNGHYTGVANLPSGDPAYIELLIGRGWKFTKEFLAPYKLELATP